MAAQFGVQPGLAGDDLAELVQRRAVREQRGDAFGGGCACAERKLLGDDRAEARLGQAVEEEGQALGQQRPPGGEPLGQQGFEAERFKQVGDEFGFHRAKD